MSTGRRLRGTHHEGGMRGLLHGLFSTHGHAASETVDHELETSAQGIRALKISLLVLAATAAGRAAVAALAGSVALLGDTIHNGADALTAAPLWIAFTVGRRPPNRRYTYGYGRAEDLAGMVVVVAILASTVLVAYEAVGAMFDPTPVEHLWAVALAGALGFAGNQAVASRIRVGRRIGSAVLVADGHHARADALSSLVVVLGALGAGLGWDRADAVAGLVITVAIGFVLRAAALDVVRRLMDAVDPALVARIEQVAQSVAGVAGVTDARLRWIGHDLRAEVRVVVDGTATVAEGHDVAEHVHHELLHALPRLAEAIVHVDPETPVADDAHGRTAHHATGGGC